MMIIELFSVLFCAPILIYACYSDIIKRSVTNKLWLFMVAIGFPVALYNFFSQGTDFLICFTYSVLFTFALTYLFFRLGLFGGADAKCLIAISVLIPVQPDFAFVYYQYAANSSLLLFPFAITTLLNGAIFSLCVPIGLFVYNVLSLSRGELKANLRYAFIGYEKSLEAVSGMKHTRLVHLYDDDEEGGDIKRSFIFGGIEIDAEVVEALKKYHAQGKIGDKVWVTPELPFILFITAGFLSALLFGNLVFCILLSLLV